MGAVESIITEYNDRHAEDVENAQRFVQSQVDDMLSAANEIK